MKKKFENMTDEERRKAVAKKIKYYEKRLNEWLGISRKLNSGNWTKADDDLIDIILQKEENG